MERRCIESRLAFRAGGDPGRDIAAAKAEPGEVNYGSGGNGSPQHIAMALDPPLFPDQTS